MLNRIAETPNAEGDDKLSVILESTREYVSSSSGSTKTTGLTFGLTREDMAPIKEQSVDTSIYTIFIIYNNHIHHLFFMIVFNIKYTFKKIYFFFFKLELRLSNSL